MKPNHLLTCYWFDVPGLLGFGVTAYSLEDARFLLEAEGYLVDPVWSVIANVSLLDLDQAHLMPNAGPPFLRGVWYPCCNVGWSIPGAHHPIRGGNAVASAPWVCGTHVRTSDTAGNQQEPRPKGWRPN